MREQRQVSAPTSAAIDLKGEGMSVSPTERLPPGFPLEKALANLKAVYAEMQAEVLRKGLPQPWPKKVPVRPE